MSQFFASGGQSIGASTSASVLPLNVQDWFPLRMDWLDLLAVQGTLMSLLQKKAESLRIDAFELWCWRGLLRVPWTVRIKPVNPKGNQS